VGFDVQVADAWVIGQRGGQRRRLALGLSVLIEQLSDRGEVRRVALNGLGDGPLEGARTVGVEQAEQPAGDAAEVASPIGGGEQEGLGAGRGLVPI
jgi:hypothetical protein